MVDLETVDLAVRRLAIEGSRSGQVDGGDYKGLLIGCLG